MIHNHEVGGSIPPLATNSTAFMFRIGFGYDVHRFIEGRPLRMGGVTIPHSLGLDGHSDADVLLHALCDALLGALSLRDIGFHFPNTDPNFKGIDSTQLLALCIEKIQEKGWKLGNADCTIVAEAPKINPFVPQMQEVISKICGVGTDDISIKATTNEKMGFVGREEGIGAFAVALLLKI